ncbi:MAG TPA: heterodisulfide reductase-related iron-sulfur binding cluster [Acidimicrobiales bacterium]|nr:heterodisulfide reductase-related iron-sulfur binding cluster [Acidimicrobiales bacterium]
MDLGIVDGELATCVACGLCLPHCPTYRVTGEEALSPRGRVAAMRQVQWEGALPDASFARSMETCVQCRGCETACPSGVPFGHLIEAARTSLAEGPPAREGHGSGPEHVASRVRGAPARTPPPAFRLGVRMLRWHRLVLVGSSLLGVAQRLRLVPARLSRRLGLPARIPVRRPRLVPSGGDVWLFTGCVMDAWMRDVHAAVQQVVEATGAGVALPGGGAACCGALALHGGLASQARAAAERTMAALPGTAPILVDAAGCGALLKDYGHLLGTPAARAFGARVRDVHEWLAERAADLPAPAPGVGGARPRVAVQDPCHLRHAQRAHAAVRSVLAPYADVVELDDEGLCCGAGGAYAALQPGLAGAIRERKLAAIGRAGAPLVVSANPGCALHLAAAGVAVAHPCEVVAAALGDSRDGG